MRSGAEALDNWHLGFPAPGRHTESSPERMYRGPRLELMKASIAGRWLSYKRPEPVILPFSPYHGS